MIKKNDIFEDPKIKTILRKLKTHSLKINAFFFKTKNDTKFLSTKWYFQIIMGITVIVINQ